LVQQIEIADKWVHDEIQLTKSKPAYPPIEWLTKRISVEDIHHALMGKQTPSPARRSVAGWNHIMARLTEHDEIWHFSSPPDYWENLAGRAGIALIRGGRSIAHVITVMN
jgi:hypothetical protein